jgi:tetratricopeptide (TPR) repeat protein
MMAAAPDQWDAQIHRAHALVRDGRAKEAAACLLAVIKACPTMVPAYRLLADVQHALGHQTREAAVLEELTSLEPLHAEAWGRLAFLQAERGLPEEAYQAYRRATRLNPNECRYWEGLARTAFATQRLPRAAEARDQLVRHFPDRAVSHLMAGHIQKALGNTEDARAAYDAALALDPNSSEALYNRIDLEPPAPDHPLALQVERLLLGSRLEYTDRANLEFSLARIFDAVRAYDRAFAHYEKANAAMLRAMAARGTRYQPSVSEAWVARTLSAYPPSVFSHPLQPLSITLKPIFIVGMPRSGTSMIEQMIASHPRVAAGGELSIARDCELAYAQRRQKAGLRGPPDTEHPAERELLMEIRQMYIDRLFEHELDADYVTDKLPGNFTRVPLLRMLFPDAAIVHCRRHPVATCWSLFTANFASHDPYYSSLDHLVHYYRCYERLMSRWRAVLPQPMVEIAYEDLVANPHIEIRRLIESVGLDWNDECVDFQASRRPILTASYAQARRPIYSTSVDRWRRYEPRLETLKELCP